MLSFARLDVIRLILIVAIGLRIVGGILNTDANDLHMPVVYVMANEHRIPADSEEWEAFQPKLYHGTVAGILMVLPKLPGSVEVRIAQAVNVVAGSLTLFVLLSLLRQLPLSPAVLSLSFALIALNPKMLSMSIQATNDAYVILFGSIALAAGYRFFRDFDRRQFLYMGAGLLLAAVSKGTALALTVAIGVTFLITLLRPPVTSPALPRLRIAGLFVALFVAYFAFVAPLGGYWTRYQNTGSPFTGNEPLPPKTPFSVETFERRPGVTSVTNSFLHFRFLGMLQEPELTNGWDDYPRHRTSYWSSLYGTGHSIHYDFWPATWATRHEAVRWLLRFIFVVALLPTALLLAGVVRDVSQTIAALFRPERDALLGSNALFALAAVGYLGFGLLYAYLYRDFGAMKAVYLYPAVATVAFFFARELQRLDATGAPLLRRAAFGTGWALCACYVLEATILIGQLVVVRLTD
jgi:hypothetical protein